MKLFKTNYKAKSDKALGNFSKITSQLEKVNVGLQKESEAKQKKIDKLNSEIEASLPILSQNKKVINKIDAFLNA